MCNLERQSARCLDYLEERIHNPLSSLTKWLDYYFNIWPFVPKA